MEPFQINIMQCLFGLFRGALQQLLSTLAVFNRSDKWGKLCSSVRCWSWRKLKQQDFVYSHACLLFLYMLVKYNEDSIKERNGNREKFWKIAMIIQKMMHTYTHSEAHHLLSLHFLNTDWMLFQWQLGLCTQHWNSRYQVYMTWQVVSYRRNCCFRGSKCSPAQCALVHSFHKYTYIKSLRLFMTKLHLNCIKIVKLPAFSCR